MGRQVMRIAFGLPMEIISATPTGLGIGNFASSPLHVQGQQAMTIPNGGTSTAHVTTLIP